MLGAKGFGRAFLWSLDGGEWCGSQWWIDGSGRWLGMKVRDGGDGQQGSRLVAGSREMSCSSGSWRDGGVD